MKFGLIIMTDGRDYIHETIESFRDKLPDEFKFDQVVIVNDKTGDTDFEATLRQYGEMFSDTEVIVDTANPQRGFTKQIIRAWELLSPDLDFVFHLEDDFIFLEDLEIEQMAKSLNENKNLVQLALLRGPVNEDERRAGGIREQFPESYVFVEDAVGGSYDVHRRFFTTNPSLYPLWITGRGWPACQNSEGIFGYQLYYDHDWAVAGFWRGRVTVEHIGHVRSGTGY